VRLHWRHSVEDFHELIDELAVFIEKDVINRLIDGSGQLVDDSERKLLTEDGKQESDQTLDGVKVHHGFKLLPYWVAKPYIRPPFENENNVSTTVNAVAENADTLQQTALTKEK
jgi:hypothetical protein